jgi:hypothetical protein
MTEFNRSDSTRTDSAVNGMAPGGAVSLGVLREAEAWTSAQCELGSGMGAIWADWLRRQREAIDASARSFQQMFECRNPADFAQIQHQWFAEAARRGACDMSALACDSIALTCRVIGADRAGARAPSSPMRAPERAKPGDGAGQRAAAE